MFRPGYSRCLLKLSVDRLVDEPKQPRLHKKLKGGDDFYSGHPEHASSPTHDFHFDYDFGKYDVQSLSRVFGKGGWEIHDLMSDIVHAFDPDITSMYDAGGRENRYQRRSVGMSSRFHTYGQQLGWHSLFLAAARLVDECPVTDDSYDDEPWQEWLDRYVLTRKDRLWLSDGADWAPPDLLEILMEAGEEALELTGDREKILSLARLHPAGADDVVVAGNWSSFDGIRVNIWSALVAPETAHTVARKLIEEEPMRPWLPAWEGREAAEEYLPYMRGELDTIPWLVRPSAEGKLDDRDPYATIDVVRRPRIAQNFASTLGLASADPFGRVWRDLKGHEVAWSRAWGFDDDHTDEGPGAGVMLSCSKSLIEKVMETEGCDLILLLLLQKYDRGFRHEAGKYTYTVGLAHLRHPFEVDYHAERVNFLHKFRY